MEETLPPQTEEGTGFESTRLRQFTVFLDNRGGRLQALVRAFEEQEARIIALSIEESGDAALVRLICSSPELGRDILKKGNFSFAESDLLAVELPKRTQQPFIAICTALLSVSLKHCAFCVKACWKSPAKGSLWIHNRSGGKPFVFLHIPPFSCIKLCYSDTTWSVNFGCRREESLTVIS